VILGCRALQDRETGIGAEREDSGNVPNVGTMLTPLVLSANKDCLPESGPVPSKSVLAAAVDDQRCNDDVDRRVDVH